MTTTVPTTYSILINWCDGDREQGNFGWTGKATDENDAEDQARRAMWAGEHLDEGDEEADPYDPEDPPYGSVLEFQKGATWRAAELEAALRAVLDANQIDALALGGALRSAAKLIAEIDGPTP